MARRISSTISRRLTPAHSGFKRIAPLDQSRHLNATAPPEGMGRGIPIFYFLFSIFVFRFLRILGARRLGGLRRVAYNQRLRLHPRAVRLCAIELRRFR